MSSQKVCPLVVEGGEDSTQLPAYASFKNTHETHGLAGLQGVCVSPRA